MESMSRVEAALGVETHTGEAQSLAVNLGGGAVAAGAGTADVGPVGADAGVAQQHLVIEVDGGDDIHIGEVGAAEIGVVVDEHVTGGDLARNTENGADGVGHGAEVDGDVGTLGHHVAVDVENAARVVACQLEERGVSRLGEHNLHLFGGGDEGVFDDLEGDVVEAGCHGVCSFGPSGRSGE